MPDPQTEAYEQITLKRGTQVRGVRYKILAPTMVAHIEAECARKIDKNGTNLELNEAITMMAVEQMVVGVTDPVVPEKLAGAVWKALDPIALHDAWGKVFNAKETATLKRVYALEHSVSKDEIDEIMSGKVSFAP